MFKYSPLHLHTFSLSSCYWPAIKDVAYTILGSRFVLLVLVREHKLTGTVALILLRFSMNSVCYFLLSFILLSDLHHVAIPVP